MIPSLGLVAAWGGGVDSDPELFAGPMNAILEPLVNSVTPRCSDGLDNDGDGLVDFGEDPGCSDPLDALETSALACDDGLDNDGDGLCDQADPGCASPLYPREDPDCDDGLDNDGDGRIDWDGAGVALPDPGCFGGADNSETAGKASCGLGSGLEAAGWSLLLGLALVLRRRFRSTES